MSGYSDNSDEENPTLKKIRQAMLRKAQEMEDSDNDNTEKKEKAKHKTLIEILKDPRERAEIERGQTGCGLVITASEDKAIKIF